MTQWVSRHRHHIGGCGGARWLGDGDEEEEAALRSIWLNGGGGHVGARAVTTRRWILDDPSGGDKTLARMGQGAVEP
jgi:hypothetical protein